MLAYWVVGRQALQAQQGLQADVQALHEGPPGVLLGLVQALLDLQVGLSVQVHGLNVANALLVLRCEQQQVSGEELVLVHRHDVAGLDVGPRARLKLLRLRVEHVHLRARAGVRRAPCVCGCGSG